jgi:hypothetical protein
MIRLKWIAAGCGILLLSWGVCRLGRWADATKEYHRISATFDSLPGDDIALRNWLMEQPGIVPNTVKICRVPDALGLIVEFTFLRYAFDGYPLPDLDRQCELLGYIRSAKGFEPMRSTGGCFP